VACKNLAKGEVVIEDCEVGCDACGRCASDAPGVITMIDNLPVVDYDRNHDIRTAIDRCPTGAIVWFDEKLGPQPGRAARRVVRQGERRAVNT
jgi:ferredoxin